MNRNAAIRLSIVCLLVVLAASTVRAQDDPTPDAPAGVYVEASGWRMIDLDDPAPADAPEQIVVFLDLDDGETLLEVVRGVDLIYRRGDDGHYSGALLIPTDSYTYASTLEVLDEDTRQVASTITSRVFNADSSLRYERLDAVYTVWTEVERTVIEYTMFGECLGLMGAVPGPVWTTPDPLMPVRIDEDAGMLYMGGEAFTGAGGVYEQVTESPFGQFNQVITQTVTVTDESLAFRYHAIADERDDCETIYESTFVPYDGDADALFERAASLAET